MRHWRSTRRTVSKTAEELSIQLPRRRTASLTLDPSHTSFEWAAYCSTIGRILDVTMRWARLKLWSISAKVSPAVMVVLDPSAHTLQCQSDGLLELLQFFCQSECSWLSCGIRTRHSNRDDMVIAFMVSDPALLWRNTFPLYNTCNYGAFTGIVILPLNGAETKMTAETRRKRPHASNAQSAGVDVYN